MDRHIISNFFSIPQIKHYYLLYKQKKAKWGLYVLLQKKDFLIALFVLIFALFIWFFMAIKGKMESLNEAKAELNQVVLKARHALKFEEKKQLFLQNYQGDFDEFFFDILDRQSFLDLEIQRLKCLLAEDALRFCPLLRERLTELEGKKNRLILKDRLLSSNAWLTETRLVQATPIEVGMEDIKRLLSIIEHVTIDPYCPLDKMPHLIVESFELTQLPASGCQSFALEMSLIKKKPKENE